MNPISPDLELDLGSVYEPCVSLTNGQGSPINFSLIPFDGREWITTVENQVDPERDPPENLVCFWNHFGNCLDDECEVDTWVVVLSLTPTVWSLDVSS